MAVSGRTPGACLSGAASNGSSRRERLWRSVKYEEVYLKDYQSVIEASEAIGRYFKFYNEERPHQSLGYRPPAEVYHEGLPAYQLLAGIDRVASG